MQNSILYIIFIYIFYLFIFTFIFIVYMFVDVVAFPSTLMLLIFHRVRWQQIRKGKGKLLPPPSMLFTLLLYYIHSHLLNYHKDVHTNPSLVLVHTWCRSGVRRSSLRWRMWRRWVIRVASEIIVMDGLGNGGVCNRYIMAKKRHGIT